jgi:hypothetical protein
MQRGTEREGELTYMRERVCMKERLGVFERKRVS